MLTKIINQFDPKEWHAAVASSPARVEKALEFLYQNLIAFEAYVGHSGGKDSVVVQFLADKILAGATRVPMIPTLHTTKPPGEPNEVHELTRLFLYSQDREITYLPLRLLGQYPHKQQIDGTRRSEFDRSNGRAVDVVIDGKEVSRKDMPQVIQNGLFGKSFLYPIVDWTDCEVWATIFANNIPYSPEYDL